MSRFLTVVCGISGSIFFAGGALAQGAAAAPDFQSDNVAWIAMNNDLAGPSTGLGPTKADPAHSQPAPAARLRVFPDFPLISSNPSFSSNPRRRC